MLGYITTIRERHGAAEVSVTHDEKQEAIRDLQSTVNGTVAAMLRMRNIALDNPAAFDTWPFLKDRTVQDLLAKYEELRALRGW